MVKKVRLGSVGAGEMGCHRATRVPAGKIESGAVYDVSESVLARFSATSGFKDAEAMLGCGQVDAVLIAAPHFSHIHSVELATAMILSSPRAATN